MFKNLRETWKQLEDCIIRPPRAEYESSELVGGEIGKFIIGLQPGMREDFELVIFLSLCLRFPLKILSIFMLQINCRNETLKVSLYKPIGKSFQGSVPCVVYCHCNR